MAPGLKPPELSPLDLVIISPGLTEVTPASKLERVGQEAERPIIEGNLNADFKGSPSIGAMAERILRVTETTHPSDWIRKGRMECIPHTSNVLKNLRQGLDEDRPIIPAIAYVMGDIIG